MRHLTAEDRQIYLHGQQYSIGVALDISRKATAVQGRDSINSSALSPRLAIVQHHCCNPPDPSPLFITVYIIMQPMFGRSTHLRQVVTIPKQQLTVQPCDPGVLFKKSLNASRPSEYPPVRGGNVVIGTVRLISNTICMYVCMYVYMYDHHI